MRVLLWAILLTNCCWAEGWTLKYEWRRGGGSGAGGRTITYFSSGKFEASSFQNGVAGNGYQSSDGVVPAEKLIYLNEAVADPELLKQADFGQGRMNLTLTQGEVTKHFAGETVETFPGAAGQLLRKVLHAQGEPGF